jgi:hypothetical protein
VDISKIVAQPNFTISSKFPKYYLPNFSVLFSLSVQSLFL